MNLRFESQLLDITNLGGEKMVMSSQRLQILMRVVIELKNR